jgi:hypothetical protein
VAQGNYNRFDKANQLSLIGMSNNVNNQGLAAEGAAPRGAITGLGAGAAGLSGGFGQQGLANTHAGGVNIANQITQKTIINASYQLNNIHATSKRNLSRQNFLP